MKTGMARLGRRPGGGFGGIERVVGHDHVADVGDLQDALQMLAQILRGEVAARFVESLAAGSRPRASWQWRRASSFRDGVLSTNRTFQIRSAWPRFESSQNSAERSRGPEQLGHR